MSTPELHRRMAEMEKTEVLFAVITVSTSRYLRKAQGKELSDESGDIATEMIGEAGFRVIYRDIIADNKKQILESLSRAVRRGCNAIIYIGGTGITRDDITVETLRRKFQKEIVGFGEIFRHLSYQEIGPSAMLSRTTAGIYRNTAIFILPGSKNAVRLALEKLILPEIKHIIYLINR